MTIEALRSYVRVFILVAVLTLVGYIMCEHVGTGQGEIKPELVWSYLTGLLSGIFAYYMNTKENKETV